MKFTHRTAGPKKGIGNGFIPGRLDPIGKKQKHHRPLVATLPREALPPTLEGVLKKILHEIADNV